MESVTNWTVRRAAEPESDAGTMTTSRSGASTAGSTPARTDPAKRAMAPPSA